MIRHICMFKLKEDNKQGNLEELLVRVQTLKTIEQVCGFDVVCNAQGMPDSNYDVALIFDFNSPEEAFGAFIGQIRENRACIDYEF